MRNTKTFTYLLSAIVVTILGFTIHSPEIITKVSCTLGDSIENSVCTENKNITSSFASGASYSASSVFSATENVDNQVRVKVSAVVKIDGNTVATPSQQKTCFGCEDLTASISGGFDVCEGSNPPSTETVTIDATHEFQRIGASTITSYTSDSNTHNCP